MDDRKSLEKKFTDAVQEQKIPDGFIKVTDNPVDGLNSEQKVILNRKANIMFNNGNKGHEIWYYQKYYRFFDKCHPLAVVRRLTDSTANRNVTGR